MFDPGSYVVGGVALIAVVFGLVEFIKDVFSLEGKVVTVLAALLGAILMALFQVQALLPPLFAQVYETFIISITFGLSASGYYKFVNARLPENEAR